MAKSTCSISGFEKVLVATDGSAASKAAIDEAIKIARVCSSKLTVLLVVELGAEVEFWDAQYSEKIGKDMKKHLDGVKAKAEKQGVVCDVVMHQGNEPYTLIVNEAIKRKSSVIVLGSHGRTGLSRLMMGSVVSRVIGHAPCKVLVVPSKFK